MSAHPGALRRRLPHLVQQEVAPREHPRTIGWFGTTALAMGGSNQSLFLIGALLLTQGTAAVPLLIIGLLLSWAALPGWTELIMMWPNRVGGIAATCAEAFRPYNPVLSNLTGVCYWWGWVPTCGLTAILSASAIHEWYLPGLPVKLMDQNLTGKDVYANPAKYGLTNNTVPACDAAKIQIITGGAITDGSSLFCNSTPGVPYNGTRTGADVNTWQFADGVHPTPGGHKVISTTVVQQLKAYGWL